ncbi:TPA: NADPH-dependent 7-cyano-7-deazaguanine reductase QueF [Candidatus Poribacteria bacterium]|jgi:7-cyano-7-deazaguanine reductase|nr:NADPH-dependent 7-cyano-7-deazaguanine reductase QueF [Candidatus Poribacteria bacterium]HIM11041.1 NADPH-dependent 7-cyano-7-deazaguanine reductase QueF [Candidatus Poribacteria bacterium]HIO47057.1 NADPH-dependent 7-cyano-7-deazaguanine reductase QueF [Candidatus Poribacteria bacterium]HIO79799.1 NADPH-dependent 7-cyano-7-deazaguanine reductase QueF [Candidatus Poribacteria bacterium]
MKNPSSYESLQATIREMETPKIETWENAYNDKEYTVDISNPEFTAVCPKTGLPDFANITISYVPDKYCVELKSLKEYFHFYRDVGIFHEHVINKIMEDFVASCNPRKVEIEGDFNIRGGIKTVVHASYTRDK